VPRSAIVLDEFKNMKLSNDGVHLSSGSTTSFIEYLLEASNDVFPDPSQSSRDERLASLEAESTATRQLYLDLAEKLRSHVETSSLLSCRQAELIDAGINRTNENLLEIRGELYLFVVAIICGLPEIYLSTVCSYL
jgi:hypothetical protein